MTNQGEGWSKTKGSLQSPGHAEEGKSGQSLFEMPRDRDRDRDQRQRSETEKQQPRAEGQPHRMFETSPLSFPHLGEFAEALFRFHT